MFIGRREELSKLEEMHASNSFEFAVIYGRRRVGKTTLIREFCRGKRAFYFVARESSAQENLRLACEELARCGFVREGVAFRDWDSLFKTLAELAKNERLIVAFDEYPYLAASNSSISSAFQAYIDGSFKQSKIFLILCGSSMSFMEEQILGHKSPLYGRRTAQFKLLPFDFEASRGFFGGFSPEEQLALYGVTGGIPEYMTKVQTDKTFDENIKRLFLSPSSPLFEEPGNLLKQELREPALYNAIITAIATGASRLNEIATKTANESNKTAKYLSVLISLGIVEKEYPAGEAGSKKSIYRLCDGMFRFYYKFVFPNMSAIAAGSGDALYTAEIKERIAEFCGDVFEKVCAQYLWKEQLRGNLPFFIPSLGRWWGSSPKTKSAQEIDLVALSHGKGLFCECKWRSVPADIPVFRLLEERSALLDADERYYYIFSRSGFQKNLEELAADNPRLKLVPFSRML